MYETNAFFCDNREAVTSDNHVNNIVILTHMRQRRKKLFFFTHFFFKGFYTPILVYVM